MAMEPLDLSGYLKRLARRREQAGSTEDDAPSETPLQEHRLKHAEWKPKRRCVDLHPELDAELAEWARQMELSVPDTLRQLIVWALTGDEKPTEKQRSFAFAIGRALRVKIPPWVLASRTLLGGWIEDHEPEFRQSESDGGRRR